MNKSYKLPVTYDGVHLENLLQHLIFAFIYLILQVLIFQIC